MSSLFDNIINRVSKNNKKHRTQKVLDKRTFCRGCGFHVLKKTYKIHKKLFRNSDGIWLPHNMQPSRQKINKPLNLLKSEEMDKIKKMGKIKNAEKRQKSKKIYKNFCAFCGNCCIDGECKFDDKNFFEEQILHFCCLFAQNSNFLDQIILHNKCEYCQNEHFHVFLEKNRFSFASKNRRRNRTAPIALPSFTASKIAKSKKSKHFTQSPK
ncbi:hypothetical protein MHBO_003241 [Bonamia ostreae]|uniref:HNH homing endonuclease n=1 Tax=Bonamia ostreae TaxID=126728 RepID=A0ABV2APV5_9EUKA